MYYNYRMEFNLRDNRQRMRFNSTLINAVKMGPLGRLIIIDKQKLNFGMYYNIN